MADHTSRHDELIPAYALGALDGDDLRELEGHLDAGCAECRRQLDLWQGDLEELAASVPPVEPSPETRRRVLRLAGVPAAAPPPATPRPVAPRPIAPNRPWRWLALPAAALLALTAWGAWRLASLGEEVRGLRAERDRLAQQTAALDRELGLARADAERMAATLAIVSAPESRTIQLAGLGSTPGAAGKTFVDPKGGRAVFYAFDLPTLSADKTYQLWWIAEGRPVSAGTFQVDPNGTARVAVDRVENADDIQAWAVTVEPAGGVPQPTGEMVLKG
ncbi:MAG TPA: anti-sigma factor [Thermoanaerobaculia bacterium]